MGWCLSKRSLKLVDILVVRGKKLQIIHVGPVQAYGNVTFLPQSCTRLDTLANARACEKALPLPSSSNPCNGYSRDRERERERGGNCRNLLRFKITLLRPVVVRPEGKFLHEGSSPLLSSLLSPPFITPENNYGQAIFHRVVMRIERCLSFSSSWKENNASLCN